MAVRQRHHPATALIGVDDGAPDCRPRWRRGHRRCAQHLVRTLVSATTGTKGTGTLAPTDYDAPRRTESDDATEHSLDALKGRRNDAAASIIDVDETDTAEGFELPGADLSGAELSVRVVPQQGDEFTCSTCFLVHHRHRYAGERAGVPICRDCAA